MSYTADARWYTARGGDPDIRPTFTGLAPIALEPFEYPALAAAIRQAFAFFRRHGDRRYSAASLMRLLAHADRIDAGEHNDLPSVVTCEVPYSYDEDTEVKSGGVLGIAVLLPDERVMVAVHSERRQKRVGTSLIDFVRNYFTSYPVVWVHRANFTGAAFLASLELMPWELNAAGAVQYCQRQPLPEGEAVQDEPDYVIDQMLAQQRRQSRGYRWPLGFGRE